MTVKEIITEALQEIGVVPAGKDPSAVDLVWGLSKLNRLLKSISADGSNLFYRVSESFSLVAGTASYTIGTGATFNTARPNIIEQAFIRDSGNIDHRLSVRPISEYWDISSKTTQDRPVKLFYDPTCTDGTDGTIYLYYTPKDSETLHIVSQKSLTTYTESTTEVDLPEEYDEFLVTNLAVAFGPAFGLPISLDLRLAANEAKSRVIGRNIVNSMKPASINIVGGGSAYNIDEG